MPDIITFNTAQVMDDLRQTIRAKIVDLIPADKLDKMIEAEVQAFLKADTSSYKPAVSNFGIIVHQLCEGYIRDAWKELVSNPDWVQATWNGDGTTQTVLVDRFMDAFVARAPEIMHVFFAQMIGNVIQHMRNGHGGY